MKDYKGFIDELDSLSRCPEEAEKVLKELDPSASADLTCLKERKENLKVMSLIF